MGNKLAPANPTDLLRTDRIVNINGFGEIGRFGGHGTRDVVCHSDKLDSYIRKNYLHKQLDKHVEIICNYVRQNKQKLDIKVMSVRSDEPEAV